MNENIIGKRYVLLEKIGKGGYSEVYLTWDRHLNKTWAVKKTDAGLFAGSSFQLYSEIKILKNLKHEALPTVVDLISEDNYVYIVMEYIEGITLLEYLKTKGRADERKVLDWSRQICEALLYLHSQVPPIIYRDLKPSNIMLLKNGRIKLIDFGISTSLINKKVNGTFLGTIGYAPPEQYTAKTDARSDIYALGATMHHLLTGLSPKESGASMPYQAEYSNISKKTREIIKKSTRKEKDKRYRNVKELLDDIEKAEGFSKKISWFKAAAAILTAFLLSVVILAMGEKISYENEASQYSKYLSIPSAQDNELRIQGCLQAINIFPERVDAYIKMLDIYEEAGAFGRNESEKFLSAYSAGKEALEGSPNDVSFLNYRAGVIYLNYYSDENGETNLNERVQKAYSFFEAAAKSSAENFEEKDISELYYNLCMMYRKYVFGFYEAYESEYTELLQEAEEMLKTAEKLRDKYDALMICSFIYKLIFDIRYELARSGINMEEALEVFDRAYKNVGALSVSKSASVRTRESVINSYEESRSEIVRVFSYITVG